VIDRFAPTAAPRSSLIISDEPLSRETGKGTDFVAVLSEEPQGGLAMRKRSTPTGFRFVRQPDRQFYGGSSRSSGGWSSWGSPYVTPTYRW
jgi:hypothetical protein